MRVFIFLFDGVTALDAIGPYEALQRLPECTVTFVGKTKGSVRTGDGYLGLITDKGFSEAGDCDILIVPGGVGLSEILEDEDVRRWLRNVDADTRWTCSVCTGSLILAACGLLKGRKAATHWRSQNALADYHVEFAADRLFQDGKYLTGAGVSAGIDLGLKLCGMIAGEDVGAAVELSMQYSPEPPFRSGDPADASARLLELVSQRLR